MVRWWFRLAPGLACWTCNLVRIVSTGCITPSVTIPGIIRSVTPITNIDFTCNGTSQQILAHCILVLFVLHPLQDSRQLDFQLEIFHGLRQTMTAIISLSLDRKYRIWTREYLLTTKCEDWWEIHQGLIHFDLAWDQPVKLKIKLNSHTPSSSGIRCKQKRTNPIMITVFWS